MLLGCRYNDNQCGVEDFYWSYSNEFGNCYTFNFHLHENGTKRDKLHWTSYTGPGWGLRLILDIHLEDYEESDVAGVRVNVHHNDQPPFPEERSVLASPGFFTSIGFRKIKTGRESPPFGTCQDVGKTRHEGISFYADRYSYSDTACQKSCLQVTAIKQCGCCLTNYPCNPLNKTRVFDNLHLKPKVNFCNTTEYSSCVSEFDTLRALKFLAECYDRCPPACTEISYDITLSMAMWPTENKKDDYFRLFNDDRHKPAGSQEQFQVLRQNFLQLAVYPETLKVDKYVTNAKYDWSILLSNFGGQLGLCIGFSILSALEIFELIFDIITHLVFFFIYHTRSKVRVRVSDSSSRE
ncbi:degenerin unc-8 [Aplysia californica]|uniref:Degenerin unc-8 n=1 Tax=Aplysia californica TaxID=6500 RepID=A0ABM0K5A1_APLCA|nr:degenerin unc-8 [Aplysia californica]